MERPDWERTIEESAILELTEKTQQ